MNMNKSVRRPKSSRRKKFLKKAVSVHAKITLAFVVFYLLVSFLADPRFLLRDFREKYSSIAATSQTFLTLHIAGPPGKPVVSSDWTCDETGSHIDLAWNITSDTDDYDAYRDSSPLATGLLTNSYADYAIAENTSYAYQVIANGPLGNTSSDAIVQATGTCTIIPDPTCAITTIGNINLLSHTGTIKIKERRPDFSGTTNIANAQINITLSGGPSISSTTLANGSGFWSWTTPSQLDYGYHTVTVTAVDPGDPTRSSTDSKLFRVIKPEEKETTTSEPSSTPTPTMTTPTPQEPSFFGIAVSVENPENTVYAGGELSVQVDILKKSLQLKDEEYKIIYTLLDSKNLSVLDIIDKMNPTESDIILKNIPISTLLRGGDYKVLVRIYRDQDVISGDASFKIKELPLLNIGSTAITFSDTMRNLSWLILLLLFILLLFLALLGIEHHLSEQAFFQITENYLKKKGFVTRRKGVAE